MASWGSVAAGYAAATVVAALVRLDGARRWRTAALAAAYGVLSLALARVEPAVVHLVAPGAALLIGYWLSGGFFDRPQTGVERGLLAIDRRTRMPGRWLDRAPRWMLEALELAYALDYAVVGASVFLVWPLGTFAVQHYWTIVLAAELISYAALPWIRTRPPRAIEPPGAFDVRPIAMRRFNRAVLHAASIQVNTLPSGHVAGAVAAALAVGMYRPAAGAALLAMSILIAYAAVAGRYHYLVDVVLGGAVALLAALVFV